MPRKLTLLLILITFCLKAFPAVFVVTSNADSGPGTLRDALTQAAANDSTTMDYINFNLPDLSETGRTIILYSQLPDVTSDLVIDGTTQPGNKFGVSDAHVQLQYQTPVLRSLAGLAVHNHHDVAIYGLYINLVTNISPPSNAYPFLYNGIELVNDKNIQIGAAGKGNVVNGFPSPLAANPSDTIHHLTTSFPFENITVQDNFFGIAADGETLSINQTGAVGISFVLKQVIIGGTPAEGNLFAQGLGVEEENTEDPSDTDPRDAYSTDTATIIIQNNKIGVDYNVKNEIPISSGAINIGSGDPNGHDIVTIADNVIAASNSYAIYPINIGGKITILRNYIGTDKTLTKSFKTGGIFAYWDTNQVMIGSNDPADANYITNCNPVVIWPYTNATVNKNSFFCTVGVTPMHDGGNWEDGEFSFPVVNILSISTTSISGTATPNSNIELFYSDKCGTCSPQTYFASTTANTQGKWQYNGTIAGAVIASATLGQNTSDFTTTTINVDSVKVINSCSNNGLGSITGAVPYSAANVKWVDASGKVVGTSPDLINVKIGKYKLLVQNGGCADSTAYYEIKNTFDIDTTQIVKTQPSCGNSSGTISGIVITNNNTGQTNLDWKDASGKIWSRLSSLKNVPAGSYTLIISNADSTCTATYGPIILKNATGPNIDESAVKIQSTNCGQSTGSITNLTVTGTGAIQYAWMNAQQQTVGTDPNLINQPAGTYKLQVTDDTQCGPVYSSVFTIPETNGITIDSSKKVVTVASCGSNTGSITGIQVNGAASYKWTDANGSTLITTTPDILNVAAGIYTLTTSNGFGCILTSSPIVIPLKPSTPLPVYTATYTNACNLQNNGAVTVATDGLVKSARWVDASGNTIGSGSTLTGVVAGTYKLYLTDQNGCENYYNSYTIQQYPEFTVSGYGNVTADACDLNSGAVDNTIITGGIPPYTYTWTDANNKLIAATNAISNLAAGTYNLNVTDNGCGNVDITYTVTETTNIIAAPSVSDMQLCSSGSGIIVVNNASTTATYRLYDGPISTTPLDEEKGGRFNINSAGNQTYYVSQVSGSCESPRARLQVTVGLSSLNIANAFTPNGDGINDYWQVNNIQSYPDAMVQIYNRYGQKLFESKGYIKPFDGTYNGQKLGAGVYYYIINLNNKCNILSGSLTLIR